MVCWIHTEPSDHFKITAVSLSKPRCSVYLLYHTLDLIKSKLITHVSETIGVHLRSSVGL